jgi:hypothetical protein
MNATYILKAPRAPDLTQQAVMAVLGVSGRLRRARARARAGGGGGGGVGVCVGGGGGGGGWGGCLLVCVCVCVWVCVVRVCVCGCVCVCVACARGASATLCECRLAARVAWCYAVPGSSATSPNHAPNTHTRTLAHLHTCTTTPLDQRHATVTG